MTPEQTDLVRRWFFFWQDTVYDWGARLIGEPDWWEALTTSFATLPCTWFGLHVPARDHCDMPEHDSCAWCQHPMPGMAHRPGTNR